MQPRYASEDEQPGRRKKAKAKPRMAGPRSRKPAGRKAKPRKSISAAGLDNGAHPETKRKRAQARGVPKIRTAQAPARRTKGAWR